jgi:dihydroxyacetone kinase
MTRLFDDPATFMEDMLAGFLDANSSYVVGVPGGVVRAEETRPGKVAVLVGGGSGHYPAFAGIVGPGFADGAIVGNIFTSPSAEDAHSVAVAANGGGGVVITSGNYAGDVMHFTAGMERLNREGIETRAVFVTDDVASAPVTEIEKRRGIAGDFVVFKVMGAAAEAGYPLDEVVRVGNLANDRTRTLGVAFSGCTLPGADHPLFTVPPGKMGVGLGIHGEPGVSEDKMPTAAELAVRLVDGALSELDVKEGSRVGVILNGLGATKYEELFVVWATVAKLLAKRGLVVIDPEVGELVTSLDMAGCSLTVVDLDDELESFWRAGADTPAYRKGTTKQALGKGVKRSTTTKVAEHALAPHVDASPASRACAARVFAGLEAMKVAIVDAEDELGRMDAVAGDGDHGRGMVKGVTAACEGASLAMADSAGVESLLNAAGDDWAAKAGGTSGALWGAALKAVGTRLGDRSEEITPTDVAAAIRDGLGALLSLGKASVGDKTMLDALVPFLDSLDAELARGAGLIEAWTIAADTAQAAADATASMRPRVGRARPLAERSVGTPDPGAISLALCLRTVIPALGLTPAENNPSGDELK